MADYPTIRKKQPEGRFRIHFGRKLQIDMDVNFLFVVDVSGSMYGQRIASVNAALAECMAELRQIAASGNYAIKASVVTFAEKMQVYKMNEYPGEMDLPQLKVEPQEDGFYLLTSYSCLYKGLMYLFQKEKIQDGNQGKNTFIFLFSDAKPVDSKKYADSYREIQQCVPFKNAEKYVAYADEESDEYNKNTVMFVDYKAEHIKRISGIAGEIGKLQMTFFSDISGYGSEMEYDQLFV